MTATRDRDDLKLREAITAPFVAITDPAWWHRHLDPEERRRVMDELALTRVDYWGWRFTVMLTLSVVVAVMGLSANSPAVVIGAMLLAPLMTPVLATAASLSMSAWRNAVISVFRVAAATAWAIGLAYVLSLILPDGPLAAEVEARTRPDIRDLVVALAAGAAGSYATVRRDVSAALPGVAVAVALVPPLAAVGITLEAGDRDLALGALLLYTTNLAAIIFAGVMVFIATGFVPPRRLSNTGLQLLVAAVIAAALVVVIAVPLFERSAEAVEAVQDEVTARAVVDDWLDGRKLDPQVNVEGERVVVQLRGFEDPPDDRALTEQLQRELGAVQVVVEFVRTERATTTQPPSLSDDEALLLQVEPLVEQWLLDASGGADYALEHLAIVEGVIRIDAAGAGQAPAVEELVQRLSAELSAEPAVRLNWTARETITPGTTTTTSPVQRTASEMRAVAEAWAAESGMVLDDFAYDGERALVAVTGAREPLIYQLVGDLEELDPAVEVSVLYTERRLVTTTLPPDVFGGFIEDGPEGPTTTTG